MGVPTICGRPLVPGESALTDDNPNFGSWLPVTEVDERDAKCADSWVPRDKSLIRLTGKHPFNSEPPHADVMAAGWLTPVAKHFVRNHGAVPRLEWSTHRIEVGGLVDKPLSLSMDELLKLPQVTIPVLLTCCGNRRKEVNMVKNSQGFSWGPGAVSVNFWTGVRLSDVLKLAGVQSYGSGARCAPPSPAHPSLLPLPPHAHLWCAPALCGSLRVPLQMLACVQPLLSPFPRRALYFAAHHTAICTCAHTTTTTTLLHLIRLCDGSAESGSVPEFPSCWPARALQRTGPHGPNILVELTVIIHSCMNMCLIAPRHAGTRASRGPRVSCPRATTGRTAPACCSARRWTPHRTC